MMNEFLMWVGGILATAIFAIISFAWNQHDKDIKMLTKHIDNSYGKYDSLERNLAAFKLRAAETFATKQDVKEGFDRVMMKLDKIDEKLDHKKDKDP